MVIINCLMQKLFNISNQYQTTIYESSMHTRIHKNTRVHSIPTESANLKTICREMQCTEISVSLKIILRLFTEKENFKGIQPSSQIMESSEEGKVDCEVSEWSKWSHCENCRGYTTSTRQIMVLLEFYSRIKTFRRLQRGN